MPKGRKVGTLNKGYRKEVYDNMETIISYISSHGFCTISDISRDTGMPKPKVNEYLSGLLSIEVVEKVLLNIGVGRGSQKFKSYTMFGETLVGSTYYHLVGDDEPLLTHIARHIPYVNEKGYRSALTSYLNRILGKERASIVLLKILKRG